MKIKELKSLSSADLSRKELEFRAELLQLRVQQSGGQLENPARLRTLRKAIARVQTLVTAAQ
jgi:large subunit ribosomal protein L29